MKGPVPVGYQCSEAGPTDAPATSGLCYAIGLESPIAPEGYLAVRVGSDGNLTLIGEIATGTSGFVLSLDEAQAVWNKPGSDKALVLVKAWIGGMGADACDVVGQPCQEVSWLGFDTGRRALAGFDAGKWTAGRSTRCLPLHRRG